MRRNVARIGRLILAAALAYLTVGIVWETAFGLALGPSAGADTGSPWQGLLSFLAWFVLPSALWPSAMSANDGALCRDDGAHVRSARAPGTWCGCAYRIPAITPTTISTASTSR